MDSLVHVPVYYSIGVRHSAPLLVFVLVDLLNAFHQISSHLGRKLAGEVSHTHIYTHTYIHKLKVLSIEYIHSKTYTIQNKQIFTHTNTHIYK